MVLRAHTETSAFPGDCFAMTDGSRSQHGVIKKVWVLESDAAELEPGLLDLCGPELTV